MSYPIKQLVLASNNQGKIDEISLLLNKQQIKVIPQREFNIIDVDEIGTTFVENAILKAKYAAKISGLPALADDSGLVVDALGGEPGIYSARYASKKNKIKNDNENNKKLLKSMRCKSNRKAKFVCIMALCLSDSHPLPILSEGIWHGEIAKDQRGNNGFGYDSIFYLPTHKITAAELKKSEKNCLSHRSIALQSLLAKLLAIPA